ncbi:MAG: cyclic nucleotide-binding/CBS domain-containing protein [Hyphomicrobiales bacterium]
MKVRDLMQTEVRTCTLDTDLGTAARVMWDHDCGIVPVTDGGGRIAGVVTDRDICIAAATKDRAPSQIRVREVMDQKPRTCGPDDDVRRAMEAMAEARVRRLPVVEKEKVRGILSLNDLILRADAPDGRKAAGGITHADVVRVLQAISEHRIAIPGAA